MAIYCVTYEDENATTDCETVGEKVARFPNHCHAQKSTWLISTNWNWEQITAYLKSALDARDKLTVVPITGWSVKSAIPGPVSAWLQTHFSASDESVANL